jgi:TetR/AcrR family transcriptional repressor of uid operon
VTKGTGSAEAIIVAARQVIAESGPVKLRLAAVAAKAGVSRPTLYRWFPTKADLMAAITVAEEQTFAEGLEMTLDGLRSPARRLDAALRFLVTYLDVRDSSPVAADPTYTLMNLNRALTAQIARLSSSLGDSLRMVPAVADGSISCDDAAEIFLRVAYSHYLAPHADPEQLLRTLRAIVGLPRRSQGRLTA